ncbi:uncharacterized protein LOC112515523 isoform X2 [Cynara cardunculus var. scolymus]|uniref:uncharacterized protein LOC112515523 isoform X2 n=1 Tax=Cynara cardunculus var. scolymus TaxID=59895 RepID=UPI000D62E53C|nr:uncharacterized protein LOC112515523 isoform X2 [Cynara cardunculus var. scolymus]
MGSCASSPVKTIKPRKPRRHRSKKTRRPEKMKKKNNDVGDRVAASDVQTTTNCMESVSSNSDCKPAQMEAPRSQGDANADDPWFDSVSNVGDSNSDDDFISVHGDDDLQLEPNEEAVQDENMSSHFLENKFWDQESHESNAKIDNISAENTPIKGRVKQENSLFFLSSNGHELPYSGDDDDSTSYKLGRSYSSFNGDKDDKNEALILKPGVPQLFPSASFNDKITNTSNSGSLNQTNKLTVIRLVKRSPVDGEDPSGTCATEKFFYRPRAGLLIPCCTDEKPTPGCWSAIDPSSFTLRGENYFKDKSKRPAPSYCPYTAFGVDLFVCPKKINHIAKHIELPTLKGEGDLPPLLIVNIQLPSYSAQMFLGDSDGEGVSLVLYFKLSETYKKDTPPSFLESIKGSNYFEIDLDIHRFSYIARKGLDAFRERLKDGIMNLGLTIQAQKPEELPEKVLCCLRLNKIDFVNHGQIPTLVAADESC